jgi:hypothetical protein
MKPPVMSGVIERRLLVNYRIDPDIAAELLPEPFRPQLVGDWAVAGICLIRLGHLRPRGFPAWMGLPSENAAHRIAVEWDTTDGVESGVFIPRRDSNALANVLVGGRLFPGEHNRARFQVVERDPHLQVAFASRDGEVQVDVRADVADSLYGSELFADLGAASEFFRKGSLGYSPRHAGPELDGLELETREWRVEPLQRVVAHSSFFDAPERVPSGSATLDCALLMRDVPARWLPQVALRDSASVSS